MLVTAVLDGRDVELKCHRIESGKPPKDTVHMKMKVTFAGSSTLLGCTFTLGSPKFVGIIVGVGSVSFISVLELLGVMVGEGRFTIGDEELRVGIATDLVSGRILATLDHGTYMHDYNNGSSVLNI